MNVRRKGGIATEERQRAGGWNGPKEIFSVVLGWSSVDGQGKGKGKRCLIGAGCVPCVELR